MTTQYIVFNNQFTSRTIPGLSRILTDTMTDGTITDVCLVVASTGGNVTEGIAVHELIKAHPKPVSYQVIGNADSIAITVMLACKDRYATALSRFVFHPIGAGSVENLTLTEGQRKIDLLLHDQNRLKAIYTQRTNIGTAELNELFERELFHDNAWALKNGFITAHREFVFPAGARVFNAS